MRHSAFGAMGGGAAEFFGSYILVVTVLTTFGPVTNMNEVFSTMKMKSVIAGEYTAPPAQGP